MTVCYKYLYNVSENSKFFQSKYKVIAYHIQNNDDDNNNNNNKYWILIIRRAVIKIEKSFYILLYFKK